MEDIKLFHPVYKACRIEFVWHFIGTDGKLKTIPFMTRAVCIIPDFLSGNIKNHSMFLMN